MVSKCVVSSCSYTSSTVFNFPVARATRETWLKALNLDLYYKFTEPTGVCELHFNPNYLKKVGHTTLLAVNAVPDLIVRNLPQPQPDLAEINYAFNNGNKTFVALPNTAAIIPQQLLLSNNHAVPTVAHLNIAPTILHQLLSSKQKVLVKVNGNHAVPTTVAHLNSIPITVQEPPNNNEVVIKMEIDDETPQPNSVDIQKLRPPIALPMIEPDSIKIEVENPESDIPDPLDTFLDRIQNIQKRNSNNAALQAEMKELKVQIKTEKSKVAQFKRRLKANAKKFDKLTATDKQNTEKLLKFGRLKNIYLKRELKIPKLMYDRFGIGEFDGLKYPDDLKQFAIELYSKSAYAYDYVRESLCKVIPHPDAILRWTKPPVALENEE